LTHPDRVEIVAHAYVEAGSQVILTNTFGATRSRLASHGLSDKTVAINKAGVEISKRAAAGRALVFASMGPAGKLLASGSTSLEEPGATYAEQPDALAQAEADALLLETFTDLEEVGAAISACKKTGLPVIASLVFDSGVLRDRTIMDATYGDIVAALAAAGADVIGANCGRGIDGLISITKRLRAVTTLPLWIKASAGLPEIVAGRIIYPAMPEFFADKAQEVINAGATFIGGCCGTNPSFIAAIAKKAPAGKSVIKKGRSLSDRKIRAAGNFVQATLAL
jgi:methionine synthase I (cobalamin-dependent)